MKTIEVDEELYRYIASHTHDIGESASDILRRMLKMSGHQPLVSTSEQPIHPPVVVSDQNKMTSIEQLLTSQTLLLQKKAVNRFMLALSVLYQSDPKKFATATESLHGRTRRYFAYDQQTLLEYGIHTNPKQIANSPYWVITNTNSNRKRNMIKQLMTVMGFPEPLIEQLSNAILLAE